MGLFYRQKMTPEMQRAVNGLLFCVTALVCLGLLMIFSITAARSSRSYMDIMISMGQKVSVIGLGVVGLILVSMLDLSRLERYRFWMFGAAVVLLGLVLVPAVGEEIYGSRRWIRFGSHSIQPSEFAKVLLLVYLAGYIKVKVDTINTLFDGLIVPAIFIGMVCGLVFLQPDYGTALLIGGVSMAVLLIAGSSMFWVGSAGIAVLPVIGYMVYSDPVRMRRITAFLEPELHSSGAAYQQMQSLIALGSGGLFGVGGGAGGQKLHYLPQVETDFIFAVVGEEFGLLGTSAVIVLFALIVWFGFRIARSARDTYSSVVAAGATLFITGQAFIHIAVVSGAAPTTGIPLPFLSQGGSSMISCLVLVGLIVACARRASAETMIFGTDSAGAVEMEYPAESADENNDEE